jgi:hypothetical protein
MNRPARITAPCLVLALLWTSSCGGSGDAPTQPTETTPTQPALAVTNVKVVLADTLRIGRIAPIVVTGTDATGATVRLSEVTVSSSNNAAVTVTSASGTTPPTVTAQAVGASDLTVQAGNATVTRHIVVTSPTVVIDLVPVGPVPAAALQALQAAAVRWQDTFGPAWAATTLSLPAGTCMAGQPAINNESIAGIRVYVTVDNAVTNGAGARGGSCVYDSGRRTVIGRIYLSTAVVTGQPGYLQAATLHEMGHVLGIPYGPLVTGNPGPDPRFTGAQARQQFVAMGGVDAGGVPMEVEATAGAGAAYTHWRASALPGEIMTWNTGYGQAHPTGGALSAVSIGALADQGYPMRIASADPYAVSGPLAAPARLPTTPMAVLDRRSVVDDDDVLAPVLRGGLVRIGTLPRSPAPH